MRKYLRQSRIILSSGFRVILARLHLVAFVCTYAVCLFWASKGARSLSALNFENDGQGGQRFSPLRARKDTPECFGRRRDNPRLLGGPSASGEKNEWLSGVAARAG
jgi:hypothetical protein